MTSGSSVSSGLPCSIACRRVKPTGASRKLTNLIETPGAPWVLWENVPPPVKPTGSVIPASEARNHTVIPRGKVSREPAGQADRAVCDSKPGTTVYAACTHAPLLHENPWASSPGSPCGQPAPHFLGDNKHSFQDSQGTSASLPKNGFPWTDVSGGEWRRSQRRGKPSGWRHELTASKARCCSSVSTQALFTCSGSGMKDYSVELSRRHLMIISSWQYSWLGSSEDFMESSSPCLLTVQDRDQCARLWHTCFGVLITAL